MPRLDTLQESFRHNDWGREKLLTLSAGLSDEQLDRPFELGPGSLRAALRHLYGAERIWFERWQGRELSGFPHARGLVRLDDLRTAWRSLAVARNEYLDARADTTLQERITYTTAAGQTYCQPLGELALHVCNHGIHHRAQALNMLRHLDVQPVMLDYLAYRAEQPTVEWDAATRATLQAAGFAVRDRAAEPARLDVATLRMYYRYGDWARDRVHEAAAALNDEQFDRPFEMGLGTLRKTLLHIRDAEQWWYENWVRGPQPEFRALPASTTIAELGALFQETARNRYALLAQATDTDLQRVVGAYVRPDLQLRFRLGESMLQLCGHGTQHRAQALNMLRHLGVDVPLLDLVVWARQRADGAA